MVESVSGEPIKMRSVYMLANSRAVFFSQPIRRSPKGAQVDTCMYVLPDFSQLYVYMSVICVYMCAYIQLIQNIYANQIQDTQW